MFQLSTASPRETITAVKSRVHADHERTVAAAVFLTPEAAVCTGSN